jgi:hypothetical protein
MSAPLNEARSDLPYIVVIAGSFCRLALSPVSPVAVFESASEPRFWFDLFCWLQHFHLRRKRFRFLFQAPGTSARNIL